jgi:transcriptional regulator with XRE-family HTH domain
MRHKWQDIRRAPALNREAARQLAAEERAIEDGVTLAGLRAARGATQAALAEALDSAQPNIARLETRADHYLSTLSAYVAALGGQLHLVATFPDGAYTLRVPAVEWDEGATTTAPTEPVTAD